MAQVPTEIEWEAAKIEQTDGPITKANADAVARVICDRVKAEWKWTSRIVWAIARYGKGATNFTQLSGPEKHYWRHTRNFPKPKRPSAGTPAPHPTPVPRSSAAG
jgi:hypothetical protein